MRAKERMGNQGMAALQEQDWLEWAAQYNADFSAALMPIVIERGEGATLVDTNGHRTIDMNEIVANIGHSHPRHVAAIQEAAARMITGKGSTMNPGRVQLAKMLAGLTPPNLNKVFLTTSGSEACEWAIRIAQRAKGRHEILSFWGSLHGRTYAAMSLTGLLHRKRQFGPLMPGRLHAPYPYCYRCPFDKEQETCNFFCIDHIDRVLEAEGTADLAALIVEPYLGLGGAVFPPPGYLPRLQAWAAERDVVFILDEVQSSFGRTGKMLALEWESLRPNMLCIGKGLGSGVSIAALIAEDGLMSAVSPAELAGSNGGNPLACAAALAVIDVLQSEHLLDHAVAIGAYMRSRLDKWQAKYPAIGDVRGQGLCLAAEFVKDRKTKEPMNGIMQAVARAAYPRGVFLPEGGHILKLRPPLVITESQAEFALDTTESILDEVL